MIQNCTFDILVVWTDWERWIKAHIYRLKNTSGGYIDPLGQVLSLSLLLLSSIRESMLRFKRNNLKLIVWNCCAKLRTSRLQYCVVRGSLLSPQQQLHYVNRCSSRHLYSPSKWGLDFQNHPSLFWVFSWCISNYSPASIKAPTPLPPTPIATTLAHTHTHTLALPLPQSVSIMVQKHASWCWILCNCTQFQMLTFSPFRLLAHLPILQCLCVCLLALNPVFPNLESVLPPSGTSRSVTKRPAVANRKSLGSGSRDPMATVARQLLQVEANSTAVLSLCDKGSPEFKVTGILVTMLVGDGRRDKGQGRDRGKRVEVEHHINTAHAPTDMGAFVCVSWWNSFVQVCSRAYLNRVIPMLTFSTVNACHRTKKNKHKGGIFVWGL